MHSVVITDWGVYRRGHITCICIYIELTMSDDTNALTCLRSWSPLPAGGGHQHDAAFLHGDRPPRLAATTCRGALDQCSCNLFICHMALLSPFMSASGHDFTSFDAQITIPTCHIEVTGRALEPAGGVLRLRRHLCRDERQASAAWSGGVRGDEGTLRRANGDGVGD